MQEYDFRPIGIGEDELRAVAELFRVVWPEAEHLTRDYLHWLYVENPSGPVIGFNAWSGEVLAGHYVVIPIRAAFHGRPCQAALSLNTAVHSEHQGRGLFTRLAQQTYELAKSEGVHHVVGVANANSTPGFLRKLEFQLVKRLDARILWRQPTLRAASECAPPSWTRIWEPEDLRWRLQNPSVRYSVQTKRGCRQILAPTGKCRIHAILKLELASEAAALDGVDVDAGPLVGLKLWLGLSLRVKFSSLGGLAVPQRFRASPLNLIIRYLEPGSTLIEAQTVEFEAIDFDAY
ncbi:MAG: GNAT family N-acetyltransferase [Phycisphaerae bacterium]|nr:GNAT family N-acetyltransferase [Phycisphaerae bacterium]